MPKSCNKVPDFLVTRMATPFPVQRRGLFSNTEFVPTAHQSAHLASLFVIVQPLLQLMSAVCTLYAYMHTSTTSALHLLQVMVQ